MKGDTEMDKKQLKALMELRRVTAIYMRQTRERVTATEVARARRSYYNSMGIRHNAFGEPVLP